MKIHFIIPKNNRGWAYPLIKWKKSFKQKEILIDVINKPEFSLSKRADIIILTSRYYRSLYKTNGDYLKNLENDIRIDVKKLKANNSKITYYDLSDSTGSRELQVIELVDLFLKRQLFKDKTIYTKSHKYRPWLEDRSIFSGCNESQLNKIQLGWNLALKDYSEWPILNPNKFGFMIFKNPIYIIPNKERPITASYRGRMKGQTVHQRKAVVNALNKLSKSNPDSFITGEIIKKKDFIKEIRPSKAAVSPFGYGEICYRDMEAFINGCILIKPSMEHLVTFPNVFIENETYVPLKWDLSNLTKTLLDVDENYKDYHRIAKKGQDLYRDVYDNFELFYNHLNNIIQMVNK